MRRLCLILSLMISYAYAGEFHYDCIIKNVYKINDEGALVKESKKHCAFRV